MIKKSLFGKLPDGREVYEYILFNNSITSFSVLSYGGILKNIWVADGHGEKADVVCGFDSLDGYLRSGGYQGAIIGRVCNRIGNGRFTLDGVCHQLNKNDGENTLHGGNEGFNTKIWSTMEEGTEDEPALSLSYFSPHMEENFPGNLRVRVTYTLTKEGGISIRYRAVTDRTTVVSLTNHAYFNLGGYASGEINDHTLWLDADRINALNEGFIPTGAFIDVSNTPYDFRSAKVIGDGFSGDHPMLQNAGGYDTNFCFCDSDDKLPMRAILRDSKSKRTMRMYTDRPCVQVYTANMVDPHDPPFKGGIKQYKHCAVCLETQAMPDAVNHSNFTNVVLNPGEQYDSTTVYMFVNED